MYDKELVRAQVIQSVCEKRLRRRDAAKLLNLSVHQLQRVLVRYLSDGAAGIASRKRGKPENNRAPDERRQQVLMLLREKYSDFGPTLSHRKAQRTPVNIDLCRNCLSLDDC